MSIVVNNCTQQVIVVKHWKLKFCLVCRHEAGTWNRLATSSHKIVALRSNVVVRKKKNIIPVLPEHWNHNGEGFVHVGSGFQHVLSLTQSFLDQIVLLGIEVLERILEVANPSVDQLCRARGSSGAEVFPLDHGHRQSSHRGIKSNP